MKKKIIYSALSILLLLIALAFFLANQMLPIANGYSAKIMCSCLFTAEIPYKSCKNKDLESFPFVKFEVNESEKSVSTSVLGLFKRKAIYRGQIGCTLLANKESKSTYYPKFDKKIASKIPIKRDFTSIDSLKLLQIVNEAFNEPHPHAGRNTRALIVLKQDSIVAEKYAEGFTDSTPMLGWSMTKSVINAVYGILINKNWISLETNNLFTQWQNDERKNITIGHLLQMNSGLEFEENYGKPCDATKMLFQSSACYTVAQNKPLAHNIGTHWSYSSGTSNILSYIMDSIIALHHIDPVVFIQTELFDKCGMTSAIMETDPSRFHIGSSYMYATAQDWAKFGLLFAGDGIVNTDTLFPSWWVSYTQTPVPSAPFGEYGAHFWLNAGTDSTGSNSLWPNLPRDLFYADGYQGQHIVIIPSRNLMVVRLGLTHEADSWDLESFLEDILSVFY